ncbi:PHP domain-containing protein [Microcella humidisoli]|uniref:Histidinol-phosphatase n=1 Tax=Microcella humidisoli TaxID=2963406 RepID=A0ABY5FW74_9MICO|nr:PHP domain-containing protein [Microcella humidisoli]UTT62531.1 PHP domain-containing protein [Microcella humidisoli]UTT62543.1 PHP domain-containing protein [Microcella humidisoli]
MTTLTADAHVHSEWSWDYASDPASQGSMARTCERAIRIGLPAIVFTEHLDFADDWRVGEGDIGEHAQKYVDSTGRVILPPFDADGYLEAIDRCRHDYPELRILTGVEFGQPHLWDARAASLLSSGAIDRVNGSLHMLPFEDGECTEPTTLYRYRPADEVMWAYLEEIPRMVAESDTFEVFTHIDYAVRSWPIAVAGPFNPRQFEEGFRAAMRAIARSGRALEMNTRRLEAWIPQWWAEEGGRAVSFGSDAHGPDALAANFPNAIAMAESFGFGPGSRPEDLWSR